MGKVDTLDSVVNSGLFAHGYGEFALLFSPPDDERLIEEFAMTADEYKNVYFIESHSLDSIGLINFKQEAMPAIFHIKKFGNEIQGF